MLSLTLRVSVTRENPDLANERQSSLISYAVSHADKKWAFEDVQPPEGIFSPIPNLGVSMTDLTTRGPREQRPWSILAQRRMGAAGQMHRCRKEGE